MAAVEILDIFPHKGTYPPGEEATIWVHGHCPGPAPFRGTIRLQVTFLADRVHEVEADLSLPPGGSEWVSVALPLPPTDGRGYGVDGVVTDEEGRVVARTSTAVDVLSRWTMAPRYGFLSDFPPDRADVVSTIEGLARYHINGLQFYDWMYRHEDLLADQETYQDPLGRWLSRQTVRAFIEAAHRRNIAAMAYTAVYGASVGFGQAHPDWALYDAQGRIIPFGQDFLSIMNPAPDSPWTDYLIAQFVEAMHKMGFDGIHLDQYGDPKAGFDAQGRPVEIAQAFHAFIRRARERLVAVRPEAAVVFNAVGNWPIEDVAQAPQDFLYIEVWPPHTRYYDLWSLIVNARRLGEGKPVVLAVYIPPSQPHNVRLADAVIFASGGFHIELGEQGKMLADPYFPNYQPVPKGLAGVLRRYYDFVVRYENLLALETEDVTEEEAGSITIEGVEVTHKGDRDRVWVMVRRGAGVEVIHLINLVGLPTSEWSEALPAGPSPLEGVRVRCYTDRRPRRVWLASPDFADVQARPLPYRVDRDERGSYVTFTVPRLDYWDLIAIECAR